MNNAIIQRLKRNSRLNKVAIAVGSTLSEKIFSIPKIAEEIVNTLNLDFKIQIPNQYFQRWNELVEQAEKVVDRDYLVNFVKEKMLIAKPKLIHTKIASLPISNFIDATFDRSLYKAILSVGKVPRNHDWLRQNMGSWNNNDPMHPNIFFLFCNPEEPHPWYGIYEPNSRSNSNNIQLTNITEMLTNKDLILANFDLYEAEFVLHLPSINASCNKIVNFMPKIDNPDYWCHRGVYIDHTEIEEIIDDLLPISSNSYTLLDMLFPRRNILDITRDKEYDCFISHFSGDKPFVSRLAQDLRLRHLNVWMDNKELDGGDLLLTNIEKALSDSYSFVVVLSDEALASDWVNKELNMAYELRKRGVYKIVPVLYKNCEIPLSLQDHLYIDFRLEEEYYDKVSLLERSIRNAVNQARNKE